MSILEYLNEVRRSYKIPEAFLSWDSVHSEVVKTKIEDALNKHNLNVSVGFDCVDDEAKKRVKMGYKINDEKRKYKYFRYD